MNRLLFNDLYSLIRKNIFNKGLTEEIFEHFLLGGLSKKRSNSTNPPQKQVQSTRSNKSQINSRHYSGGVNYSKSKQEKQQINLNDLLDFLNLNKSDSNNLLSKMAEIKEIYSKHSIDIPNESEAKALLENLFIECIKETTEKENTEGQSERKLTFSINYKQQQLKPSTIKSTLGRDNQANELREILSQHHKVILYSQLGTGKTRFIKYCLSKWGYKNYCYISYTGILKSTIRQINIQNEHGSTYKGFDESDLRNTSFSSSLLVIDNMYSTMDISAELEQMSSWSMDIVIITLNRIVTDTFYNYELPLLNDEILYAIFTNISGIDFKNEHQKIQFSFITQKNVLLTTLVAYQCRKIASCHNKVAVEYKEKSKTYPSADILDNIISKLETGKKHHKTFFQSKHRFKIPYNKESLNLIEHTRFFYQQIMENKDILYKDNTSSDDKLHRTMLYLSCFGWAPIPRIFISEILSPDAKSNTRESKDQNNDIVYDNVVLTDLSEMGLLTLSDDTVQLSPLIAHAVIANETLSIKALNSTVNNIICFLENYEQTLSIPYLSNILIIFAENLYELVPEKNNPNQKKTSKQFENWQKMLYLIFMYYNQNNAPDLAQRVIELIKYPESLINKHNFLDKSFFSISNNIHMISKISEIPEQIDQLCDSLKKLNDIETLDMINFVTSVSDIFIDGYLYLFANPVHEKGYAEKYTKNFITVMDKLISFIWSNKDFMYIKSLYPKRFYYISTYSLLKKEYLYSNDYYNYRLYNRSYKNINCAICSHSITIILMGTSIMLSNDVATFKHNLIPLTSILNDYINNCELIPYHTFRLCLYAYIIAGMVQNTFISNNSCEIDDCFYPALMNHDNIHFLLNRCNLSKELYIDSIEKIDPILTELESNMKSN